MTKKAETNLTQPHGWHLHPHVRSGSDLSRGERSADYVRNKMGSWPFVFGALIFLAIWMVYNGRHGFDPYPFILLNLLLSCLAAMQGAILLIAAKRQDQIASELAKHTFEIDSETLDVTKEIAKLARRIDELTLAIHDHIKNT
ncbi:MAG: DUF1003 domain-containing protein [Streptomycetaceae bacterium]|nr:MAG: DUF1003 domain-containing protein [Streptomycetaceae bacterium]